MKQFAELGHGHTAALQPGNAVHGFRVEKRALALVQRIKAAVQQDFGGSLLADDELIFKMPMREVVQIFVAVNPDLCILIKNAPLLFRHGDVPPF